MLRLHRLRLFLDLDQVTTFNLEQTIHGVHIKPPSYGSLNQDDPAQLPDDLANGLPW